MLSIRWATVEDAAGVAAVHVNAWRVAYAGLIDQAVLDRQSVEARTQMWRNWIARSQLGQAPDGYGDVAHRLLVAELDGEVLGWASFGGGRDDDRRELGELAGLYVDPTSWTRGVGHALIERAQQELAAAGWTEGYLWVLDGNARAIRFYERHGWRADGGEKFGEGGSVDGLHELRYVRPL